MDFYDVVKKRRSYRFFKQDMPEKEKIERILEAARLAPTWSNKQGAHYIIVKEPNNVKAIWEAVGQKQKFAEAVHDAVINILGEEGEFIIFNELTSKTGNVADDGKIVG